MQATLNINSEQDAWNAISGILDGKIDLTVTQLDFSKADWIRCHLNYKGPRLAQTLTPTMMHGIVEYQRQLHRAIALITKGEAKVSKLTDVEKVSYELLFEVKNGSTDLSAAATPIIDSIGKVFDGMSSTHRMVCVLLIAVLFFGQMGFDSYLTTTTEQRKIEAQSARDQQLIGIIDKLATDVSQLSSNFSAREAILKSAMENVPKANGIKSNADEAYDQIIRNSDGATSVSIHGRVITRDNIETLTHSTRRKSETVKFDGLFKVITVETGIPGGFSVTFQEVNGDRVITADLKDAIMSARYRGVIERATFNKEAIRLRITAKRIGDQYSDVQVISASKPRQKP